MNSAANPKIYSVRKQVLTERWEKYWVEIRFIDWGATTMCRATIQVKHSCKEHGTCHSPDQEAMGMVVGLDYRQPLMKLRHWVKENLGPEMEMAALLSIDQLQEEVIKKRANR